jgi:hypothetical protein
LLVDTLHDPVVTATACPPQPAIEHTEQPLGYGGVPVERVFVGGFS